MTVIHLFFYFRLLAILLSNEANKITDGNPSKAKLGVFVEEKEAISVKSVCKGATDHESLRTTSLNHIQAVWPASCKYTKKIFN